MTVDDDDGTDSDGSNLSALGYGLSAGFSNMTEARSAQDAAFSLNGLALTNASNTINGLVDGLDVTLKKVTSGTEMITKSDSAVIEKTVQSFVDAYNLPVHSSSLMDYKSIAGALLVIRLLVVFKAQFGLVLRGDWISPATHTLCSLSWA